MVCNAASLQETRKTDRERFILIAEPYLKRLQYALNEKIVKEIPFECLLSVRLVDRQQGAEDVLVCRSFDVLMLVRCDLQVLRYKSRRLHGLKDETKSVPGFKHESMFSVVFLFLVFFFTFLWLVL